MRMRIENFPDAVAIRSADASRRRRRMTASRPAPGNKLHGEIMQASLFSRLVDRDDVGVVEMAGGSCFAAESFDPAVIQRAMEKDLEGDAPAQ